MMHKPLALRVAEYVCDLSFEDLPAAVVKRVKRIVLHDLAVAFGGAVTEQGRRAVEFVRTDLHGAGAATVVGQRFKASPLDAAFANAVMARALRMEDTILPSFIHPGALLVPTALAVAEHVERPGREVITALVAAYDVLGKLAGSQWSWARANRTPSHVFGAFGVAALAARLLQLDREQTATAIAYAANLAVVVTSGFQDFQYGLVTRNGISAAYLGACRAPAPRDALEGPYSFYASQFGGVPPEIEASCATFGRTFEVLTAVLKPYPCTAINLVPITLLQRLLRQHGLGLPEVARVTVHRARQAAAIPNVHHYGPFDDGPFAYAHVTSLPFAFAITLIDGTLRPERFVEPNDPHVLQAARRVAVELVDGWDLLTHRVEITTNDGRRFVAQGGREVLPVPDPAALLERYGAPVVGREKARRLLGLVNRLEVLDRVHPLAECLVGG